MPASFRLIHLLPVLLSILVAASASQAADPATGKEAARIMLEKGWGKSATARTVVDEQNTAADRIAPNDQFVLHAHWLVLMYQGRYNESLASLEEWVTRYPSYLPAHHGSDRRIVVGLWHRGTRNQFTSKLA